ncbi:MAG: hypothetical protein AAGE93_15070 [Bacteroidota bacterium]
MASRTEIIRIEIDKKKYQSEADGISRDILKLREEQKQLNAAFKAGTVSQSEYATESLRLRETIKSKNKEQQLAVKLASAENNSIDALRAKLSALTKERNKTNQSTSEGVKRASELDQEIKELTQRIKQNEEASGDFRRNVGNYTESMKSAARQTDIFGVNLGGAERVIKTVNSGIGGTNKLLKVLKIALASTGIGAILVALGSLVTFLTRSQRGLDLLNGVTAGVSATFDVLTDRVIQAGEGLVKFFQGDIQGAVTSLRNSVTGIGEEIATEFQAARQLANDLNEVRDAEIALLTVTETRKTQMAELILLSRDQNRSAEDRLKLVDEASRLEKENLQDEIALQKEKVRILKEQNALGESTREDLRAEQEAIAELERLQRDSFNRERELENRRSTLKNEIAREEVRVAQEAAEELKNARLATAFEEAQEISRIQSEQADTEQQAFELAKRSAEDLSEVRINAENRAQEAATKAANAKLSVDQIINNQRLSLAMQFAGAVQGIFKQESLAYKVIASGRALIDTYMAANAALKVPPGPPATFPNALLTVGIGLANVAKINDVQFAREGAIVPRFKLGSILNGPSHEKGGIILTVGGKPTVEAEGNEIILTRGVTENPALLAAASALNVAGGGIPLAPSPFAENGAIVSATQAADQALQTSQLVNAFKNVKIVASFEEFVQMQEDYQNTIDLTTI